MHTDALATGHVAFLQATFKLSTGIVHIENG